jgi:3-hydroxy acid dehydrogenase / malonic semialdehyde reductase
MKILITGATAGIGEATARRLHSQGHHVWLTGRRQERLHHIKASLDGGSTNQGVNDSRVTLSSFDLRDPKHIQDFVDTNQAKFAKVDVLINNAGLAKGTEKFQNGHIQDWQEMFQTNVLGLLSLSRAVIPHMVSRKSGHIVNLGSVAGRWVYPGGAVYCASKFAVRALSEGMRMDLAGTNVRVSNIEPGMVNTEFSLVRLGDQAQADRVYQGMQPLTGEDIAETISWVIDRPAHINIQELVIYPTAQAHVGQVHRS